MTRTAGWPLWTAALWVLQEALRGRLPFGGFPWGRLAFSQGDSPLTPLAALGGAPLVTLVVALLAGALAWAVLHVRSAPALAAVTAVVPVLAAVGTAALVPLPTSGEAVRVAVVQGNVPRLGLDFNAQRAAVLGNHVEATRQLAADVRAGRVEQPDLVVWPENASDIDPFTDPAAYDLIDAAVQDVGVPVLVGAVLQGPGDQVSNAGIVWDPETGPGERYVKRHPVPFGEYIPYRSLVRRVTDKVDLVPRDFAAGDEVGVLDVGPVRLGDVICFEVAYDDLVRDVVTGRRQADRRADQQRDLRAQRRDRAAAGHGPAARRRARPHRAGRRRPAASAPSSPRTASPRRRRRLHPRGAGARGARCATTGPSPPASGSLPRPRWPRRSAGPGPAGRAPPEVAA